MPKSNLQEYYPVILEYFIEEHEIIEPSQDDGLKDFRTLATCTLSKQEEIL